MQDISIKWQLLAISIILVTIPVIIFGNISYNISEREIYREVEEKLALQASDWKIVTESYIKQNERILAREDVLVKQRLSAIAIDVTHMLQVFADQQEISSEELEIFYDRVASIDIGRSGYIFLLDHNGTYLVSRNREFDGANVWHEQNKEGEYFFQEIISAAENLREQETVIKVHHFNEYDNKGEPVLKVIAITHFKESVQFEGENEPRNMEVIIGAVSYYTDFKSTELQILLQNELKDKMADRKIGNMGYIWVVDSNGNYIVSKDRLRNGENIWNEQDDKGNYIVQEVIKSTKDAEEGKAHIQYYTWKNLGEEKSLRKLSASVYVPEWDWIIGASAYHHDFIQGLEAIRRTIFLVSILSIAIGSVVVYLFAYTIIVKPIVHLESASREISKGNLDVSIDPIDLHSSREISSLAQTFNAMATNLRKSVTEIKTKDKKLEEANKQLQDLDKQKDEFISLTAHELKTPLTSIRGFTQLLQDEAILSDAEQRNHYIDLIDKNTDRLYNLVLDVIDSSRLSLGKLKLNISNVDPAKLFTDIKENMSIVISGKQLTPEFSMEPNMPLVHCDYERTMQVLRNLISNSIKFTEIGSISLKIYREGDFIKFEVKDTGQGIPKENFNSIFSKFYQVDSSLTRKVGGSGLGLSICKGLIENMGGQIGFNSEVGKGSVFYFTLPIVDKAVTSDKTN
ncbi:MAG TPA: cache domain-containing protein [Alphaproteobacteria bacterium]|nr:cache domain-containing protein [Alphaproteobacteria bacterium]